MKPEILLKAYVVHQSEDAFRELVAACVDEVYSTALRIVQGVSHLAEETALRVFWELGRKAPKLGEEVVLTSWLHQHTCKTAVMVLREVGRTVDASTLKNEMQGFSTADSVQAAPRGLATRVCQGVLLNAARRKGFNRFSLPTFPTFPTLVRPGHIRIAAVCVVVVIVLWNVPFHRRHKIIIQSANVRLTPASCAQLATPEDGDAPATPSVAGTKTETNPNPQ